MGLGKKLGQQNQQTDAVTSKATTSISQGGGYNADNLGLKAQPSMTVDEIKTVREVQASASQDVKGVTKLGHLVRPNVPTGTTEDQKLINELVVTKMWRIVCLRKLQNFYTQESLQKLIDRACRHDYRLLMDQFKIATLDMTVDLAVLGLYDIVLFGDDSGSMGTEEPKDDNLTRWQILREVIKSIGFWATLMDPDGVVVRFFNTELKDNSPHPHESGNAVTDSKTVDALFRGVKPNHTTPMGKELRSKILSKFVYGMLNKGELNRPILIITATDGVPDSKQDVIDAIIECHNLCSKSKYGPHAVAFSFAQIGTDGSASGWLSDIDKNAQVGHLIDCTSEYLAEKEECEKAYPGIKFSESTWLVKLMIGPIDPTYDESDESPTSSNQSQSQYNVSGSSYPQVPPYNPSAPPYNGQYQQPYNNGQPYQQPYNGQPYQQPYNGQYQQPYNNGQFQ